MTTTRGAAMSERAERIARRNALVEREIADLEAIEPELRAARDEAHEAARRTYDEMTADANAAYSRCADRLWTLRWFKARAPRR